jgi:hypothetical protein
MTIIELEIFQQEKWIVRGYPEISLYISSSVDKSLAIVSGFSSPTAAPSQLVVMVI